MSRHRILAELCRKEAQKKRPNIWVLCAFLWLTISPVLAQTRCTPSGPAPEVSDELRASLSSLKTGTKLKYYIVDFFTSPDPGACAHGQKVLAVARQTLTRYGASAIIPDIVPIEADFFANKEAGARIISQYIASFRAEAIRKTLSSALDRLKKQKRPPESGKYYLSVLYLQALYHQILSNGDAAIISTSIYGQLLDGFNLLPEKFYEKQTDIIMLTAASDEPTLIEETYLEPIRAFWERRQEYGLGIIGAVNSQGKFGMTSRDGTGITIVGPASGWAPPDKCFNPETDCGTSFATPFVGAEILLARQYWASKGFKPDARAVIMRLMVSSDINAEVAGNYAAGGIPRLEKLLLIEGVYAKASNGQLQNVKCLDCSIKVRRDRSFQTYVFAHGLDSFIGLQLIPDPLTRQLRSFIFRDEIMRWEEVEIDSLSFNFVAADGSDTTLDKDKFFQQYKELFRL